MKIAEKHEPQSLASESRKLDYHPELDGVRAVAVLFIILFHLSATMPGPDFWGAYLMVDVFFVLSGYLITTLLLRERRERGRVSLGNFYVRRALRLLPALFLAVGLGFLVDAVLDDALPRPYWQVVGLVLSYVGNWFDPQSLGFLAPTWSLHLEEQYYILWPVILVFGLARWPRRRIAVALCIGAFACAAIRFWTHARGYASFDFYATPARADGVLLGSALGVMLPEVSVRMKRLLASGGAGVIAAFVIALGFLLTSPEKDGMYNGGLFAVNAASMLLVAHLVLGGSRGWLYPFLAFKPLTYVGRISYGLYLYHAMVIAFVFNVSGARESFGTALLAFAATLSLGIASYELIEKRALRFKGRFGTMSRATPIH